MNFKWNTSMFLLSFMAMILALIIFSQIVYIDGKGDDDAKIRFGSPKA